MSERTTDGFERGAAVGLLGRVAGYGSSFLFQLILVRVLGPQEAGRLFPALALVVLLGVVGRFGLDRGGLREVSGALSRGDLPAAMGWVRWVRLRILGFSLAVVGLALLSWPLLGRFLTLAESPWALILLLLSVPGFALAFTHGELLRADRRVGRGAVVQLVVPYGLATLATLALAAAGSATPAAVALAWCLSVAAGVFLGVRWVDRTGGGVPVQPPAPEESRELLSGGPAILWTSLVVMVLGQLDVLLLGVFVEEAAVARYVAASRTAMVASLALVGVNGILAPLFVERLQAARAGDPGPLRAVARRGARWGMALAVAASAVLLLGGPWILGLFDPGFRSATGLLAILLLGQAVNTASGAVVLLLHMSGEEWAAARIMTGVAVLVVAAYLVCIPRWGLEGAAWVTAAGMGSGNLALAALCRARLGVWTVADRLVPAALLFGGLLPASAWLWAPGAGRQGFWPLAAALWAGAAVLTLFKPEDRAWLRGGHRRSNPETVEAVTP